jgi:hypothetical protein
MKPNRLAVVAACLITAVCAAQDPVLPDPRLSPGLALDVSTTTLCTPGYPATVRHVPESEKKAVYREYGIPYRPGIGRDYEVDHLISLELCGSKDIRNLWPQIYHVALGAHQKDWLENYLHREVCAGRLDLGEAQREISSDWVKAYNTYHLRQSGRKKGKRGHHDDTTEKDQRP